jgi:hypothetical protein
MHELLGSRLSLEVASWGGSAYLLGYTLARVNSFSLTPRPPAVEWREPAVG